MRITRESRLRLRLAGTGFVILLLAVAGLVLFLAREYHLQFDWTRGGRNSLSEASRNVLQTFEAPVHITAFASEASGLRKGITAFVARYQKVRSRITLDYVDPNTDPTRVRAAGVRNEGELVVEVDGRKENLTQLTEEALTNALVRLARGGERWILFLAGHGERSPERQAGFDLSAWALQLNKRGLKTRSLSLADKNPIPDNTSVLVIAGPRVKLQAGELKQLEQYITRGGNLLWLADPGSTPGLERLGEALGVEFQRGVIVDPTSQAVTGKGANFIVVGRYGSHPVVKGFDLPTLYPDATGVSVQAPKGWESQTLLDTTPTAWLETGALSGPIRFDAGRDQRGPVNLAVTLTRKQDQREQRVAIFGDGDFLSNSFIGEGGNLELAMNLVNWLGSDDVFINVPVRTAPDLRLTLSRNSQLAIALGFLMVIPITLLAGGITVWWRRRKR